MEAEVAAFVADDQVIEQRIVAFALGHPGLGPKRISAQLARPEWGGLLVSANGVYKALVRHGLNTRAKRLAEAIRQVIADAIEAGGSSLRDYIHADGSLGYFQHSFSVYDREGQPCPKPGCGGTIIRVVQSGRSTFCCPVCQR